MSDYIPKAHSDEWKLLAYKELSGIYGQLVPCKLCGYPKRVGYLCNNCRDVQIVSDESQERANGQ